MAQRPPLLTPSTSVDHSAVAGPGTDHQQNYSNSAPPNNASLSNFAGTLFKSTKRFTVSLNLLVKLLGKLGETRGNWELWQYGLSNFQGEGTKLEIFFCLKINFPRGNY